MIESDIVKKYDCISLTEEAGRRPALKSLLGTLEGRTVEVMSSTLDALQVAQDLHAIVKEEYLTSGVSNQVTDIFRSDGRLLLLGAYMRKPDRMTSSLVQTAIAYDTGKCMEFAGTALYLAAQKLKDRPLMLLFHQEFDHVCAYFGDPREKRWGENNTVVCQPSDPLACAGTLSEARQRRRLDYRYTLDTFYAPVDRKHPALSLDVDGKTRTPMSDDELDAIYTKPPYDLPPISPELTKHLFTTECFSNMLFHADTDVKDVSTVYKDEDGRQGRCDYVPRKHVDKYFGTIAQMREAGYDDAFFEKINGNGHPPPAKFDPNRPNSEAISWPFEVRKTMHELFPDQDGATCYTIDDLFDVNTLCTLPSPQRTRLFETLLENVAKWPAAENDRLETTKLAFRLKLESESLFSSDERISLMQKVPHALQGFEGQSAPDIDVINTVLDMISDLPAFSQDQRGRLVNDVRDALEKLDLRPGIIREMEQSITDTLSPPRKRMKRSPESGSANAAHPEKTENGQISMDSVIHAATVFVSLPAEKRPTPDDLTYGRDRLHGIQLLCEYLRERPETLLSQPSLERIEETDDIDRIVQSLDSGATHLVVTQQDRALPLVRDDQGAWHLHEPDADPGQLR